MPFEKKKKKKDKVVCELEATEEKCECPPNIEQQIGDLKQLAAILIDVVEILRKSNVEIRTALKENMMAGRYGSYPVANADER